ncbi:unnamed protein product [Chrysoparadoxa australica]
MKPFIATQASRSQKKSPNAGVGPKSGGGAKKRGAIVKKQAKVRKDAKKVIEKERKEEKDEQKGKENAGLFGFLGGRKRRRPVEPVPPSSPGFILSDDDGEAASFDADEWEGELRGRVKKEGKKQGKQGKQGKQKVLEGTKTWKTGGDGGRQKGAAASAVGSMQAEEERLRLHYQQVDSFALHVG